MSSNREVFTIENDDYKVDENLTPMYHVFTTQVSVEDNIEYLTIVIGPSTEPVTDVIEWVDKEIAGPEPENKFSYRGSFDYEPQEEDLKQFAPEGYTDVSPLG